MTVFLVFLRLGLTSFGGPIAHLGYFREEFVRRRAWLTEQSYADLVALGQFLPGPASSQVGMAIGFSRGGFPGAIAAWLGFTLPSAVMMIAVALSLSSLQHSPSAGVVLGVVHSLTLVAVAVVAQAVLGMARAHCTTLSRALIALAATAIASTWNDAATQVFIIASAAVAGSLLHLNASTDNADAIPVVPSRRTGAVLLATAALILVALSVATRFDVTESVQKTAAFYRTGSLVFGGGHVVLPLLEAAIVNPGWVDRETFLAGYGAAQAAPGPLFSFAAFLGASMTSGVRGWTGGLYYLVVIFLPSFLLIIGALPFWERLRRNASARSALAGVNAAVVGILLAALYRPLFTSAVTHAIDLVFAVVAFAALQFTKLPPWTVVILSGLLGALLWHR